MPWLCCILLVSVHLHSAVHSSKEDWIAVIDTLPSHPIVYIGESLTVYCRITHPAVTRDELKRVVVRKAWDDFQRNTSIVSSTVVEMAIEKTAVSDEGTYHCVVRDGPDRMLALASVRVRVDFPPTPPDALDCIVENWEAMRCRWQSDVHYNHIGLIRYEVKWTVNYSGKSGSFLNLTSSECYWSEEDGNFIRDDVYFIRVRVTNTLNNDTRVSKEFLVKTADIVKPRHVDYDQFLLDVVNSSCVDVKWTLPKYSHRQRCAVLLRESDDFSCERRLVRYDPQRYTLQHQAEDEAQAVLVCDLEPFGNYTVGITCAAGFNSDVTQRCLQMPEDVPDSGPIVTPGGFWETPCAPDCRSVRIYWQPVPRHDQNGIIREFRIRWVNLDLGTETSEILSAIYTSQNRTLTASGHYAVYISAKTSAGFSKFESVLWLSPSLSPVSVAPLGLFAQANSLVSPLEVTVSWEKIGDPQVTGYTVYHCVGSHSTRICQGSLQWHRLPSNQSSITLHPQSDVTIETVNSRYLIGLSQEMVDESSGIIWSGCIYVKDKVPDTPPPGLGLDDHVGTSLTVHWLPYSCLESGYVINYNIQYCVLKGTNSCTEPVWTAAVDGDTLSYSLYDIDPHTEYGVRVQAVSDGGEGPVSGILATGKSRLPRWASSLLVIFALAILLFPIGGLLYCVREWYKTDMDSEVTLPPAAQYDEPAYTYPDTPLIPTRQDNRAGCRTPQRDTDSGEEKEDDTAEMSACLCSGRLSDADLTSRMSTPPQTLQPLTEQWHLSQDKPILVPADSGYSSENTKVADMSDQIEMEEYETDSYNPLVVKKSRTHQKRAMSGSICLWWGSSRDLSVNTEGKDGQRDFREGVQMTQYVRLSSAEHFV